MIDQLLTPGAGIAAALGFVLGIVIDQAYAHVGHAGRKHA